MKGMSFDKDNWIRGIG